MQAEACAPPVAVPLKDTPSIRDVPPHVLVTSNAALRKRVLAEVPFKNFLADNFAQGARDGAQPYSVTPHSALFGSQIGRPCAFGLSGNVCPCHDHMPALKSLLSTPCQVSVAGRVADIVDWHAPILLSALVLASATQRKCGEFSFQDTM